MTIDPIQAAHLILQGMRMINEGTIMYAKLSGVSDDELAAMEKQQAADFTKMLEKMKGGEIIVDPR